MTIDRFIRLLATFTILLITLGCGLCGTSLGLAFILARYSALMDAPDPNTITPYLPGIFLFCVGCFFLSLALYFFWIRPRRKPVETE